MKTKLIKILKNNNHISDIKYAYKMIIMKILKINDLEYYKNEYYITFFNFLKIKNYLKLFIKGIPLAYIIKEKEILNLKFFINKNVLIPRNETEELIFESISKINDYIGKFEKKIIFDICTGSLVIATCLFHNLKNTIIYANDISKKAIKVSKINNKILNNNKIIIKKSNIVDFYIKNKLKCNIFICNPPYIDKNDSNFLHNKEPIKALIAKNKGLFFYEEIFKKIKKITLSKSIIIFEIGFNQKDDIEKLIKFYSISKNYNFQKDINHKWRMLYIYL